MIKINENKIRKILQTKWPQLKHIWLFDEKYTAVSKQVFWYYLDKIDAMPEFNIDNFDCDDFSLLMHASIKLIASKFLPYSIAFGEVTARHNSGVHNFNLLITDSKSIECFEPQSGIFIDGENMNPFFVRM